MLTAEDREIINKMREYTRKQIEEAEELENRIVEEAIIELKRQDNEAN